MDKTKKLIITMIVLVVSIVIIIVILLNINKKEVVKENDNPTTEAFTDVEQIYNKTLFFTINNNINKYYQYLQQNNKEAVLAISSKNQVTLKNANNTNFISKEMYVLDKISNITVYVYGVARKEEIEDEYYLIINIDYTNNTFDIINSSKEEFENAKNNKINSEYKKDISIKENTYNKFEGKNITDLEVLQYYFEDYKYKALYKVEEAFELIESKYKEKRFNNDITKYKEYIQNNINRFKDANLLKYQISKNGQYGTYTAMDNYNNYYKITETAINKYNIILDNYTIENEELVNQYNKLSDQEKVSSNIDKVMKLINSKSYTELYGYLNEDFKNRYFKTQQDFEKYITSKFFDNNIVGGRSIENEGNIYIIKVPYKESLSTAAEEGEITFNMKLKEGTDFELSFNMD